MKISWIFCIIGLCLIVGAVFSVIPSFLTFLWGMLQTCPPVGLTVIGLILIVIGVVIEVASEMRK